MGLLAVLCLVPSARGADLSGTWKGAFDFNGNSVPTSLNLKVDGANVTGTVEGLITSPTDIHEGKLDGDTVTFWVNSDYQGTTYKLVYKGKVSDDHIEFSMGTDDGSWGTALTVKRGGTEPASAAAAPKAPDASSAAADAPKAASDSPKAIDVTGAWKGSFDYNGTAMAVVMNLKSAASAVTGSIEGLGSAPAEIHEGKLDGGQVSFWINVDYQGQTYPIAYKGAVNGGQIDFSFGTADGSWGSTMTVKKP